MFSQELSNFLKNYEIEEKEYSLPNKKEIKFKKGYGKLGFVNITVKK